MSEEEIEGGWDDDVLPEEPDLDDSGDVWEWVPPWKFQNNYGADNRLWGDGRPPLTPRVREALHPYEVAHFENATLVDYLGYRAGKLLIKRSLEAHDADDIVSETLIDMEDVTERKGYIVGDRQWTRTALAIMRRKVTDLLRKNGGRKGRSDRYRKREAIFYGEYVALRGTKLHESSDPEDEAIDHDPILQLEAHVEPDSQFDTETLEWMSELLTDRELESVILTYQEDFSSSKVAEKLGIPQTSVWKDLQVARDKLRPGISGLLA